MPDILKVITRKGIGVELSDKAWENQGNKKGEFTAYR